LLTALADGKRERGDEERCLKGNGREIVKKRPPAPPTAENAKKNRYSKRHSKRVSRRLEDEIAHVRRTGGGGGEKSSILVKAGKEKGSLNGSRRGETDSRPSVMD